MWCICIYRCIHACIIWVNIYTYVCVYTGFPGGPHGNQSAFNVGDLGSIPGSGRSPREENGNPFQCACLENSMDRGPEWESMESQRVRYNWARERERCVYTCVRAHTHTYPTGSVFLETDIYQSWLIYILNVLKLLNKLIYYSYNGIPLNNEKEWNLHAPTGMNLQCIMLYSFIQKKPGSRVYILCASIYMKFWKKQTFRNGRQVSGCQRLRAGGGVGYRRVCGDFGV